MRLSRYVLAAAIVAFTCSMALADTTTDPGIKTLQCGPGTGRVCATVPLTGTSVMFSITFNTIIDGVNAGEEDIINETGHTISAFTLDLGSSTTDGTEKGLLYSCLSGGDFICSGSGNFIHFTGGSIAPCEESDDESEGCHGVLIILEQIEGDPNLAGKTVSNSFFVPEPSSGLLLLFGLAAGSLMKRRTSLC